MTDCWCWCWCCFCCGSCCYCCCCCPDWRPFTWLWFLNALSQCHSSMKGFLYGSVDLSVHRSACPFHKVPFYEVPYLNKGSQKAPRGRIDGRMVEPSHRDARTDQNRGCSLAFIRSSKLISCLIFKTTDQQTDQPLLGSFLAFLGLKGGLFEALMSPSYRLIFLSVHIWSSFPRCAILDDHLYSLFYFRHFAYGYDIAMGS